MLNIYFGDLPNAIYNSKAHFNQFYTDEWILNPVSKMLIAGINGAKVSMQILFGTLFFS